ncbi:MAG: DUF262 domain-containing protein [Alphaproteobacteria bacterium]|nr:DUF262 domain-containing protein [Alphaproteobacteria bacterium]
MSEFDDNMLVYEEDTTDGNNNEFLDLSTQQIFTQSTDPNIHTLFSMWQSGDIILRPSFQRKYVWNSGQASKLIESILLGFPVPVIYVSETDDGKWLVIDGQQRLTSIIRFMNNEFEHPDGRKTEFKLSSLNVLDQYNKCRFVDLDKEAQRKLKNYSIRIVVILKNSGPDIKFDMFERLNRGSVGLNDMELRNCIYRGTYMETVKALAKDTVFRELVGLRNNEPRMKDVELVLRFMAFSHQTYLKYSAPMKKFLNDDCEHFKIYDDKQRKEDEERFKNALYLIKTIYGKQAFKRYVIDLDTKEGKWDNKSLNINTSLFDIYMWFFSTQDKNKVTRNADLIREATIDLMVNDEKFIDSITRSTSGNVQVRTRFDIFRHRMEQILANDQTQARCYTHQFKNELFEKDNTCAICGNKIMSVDDAAVDHIEQFWMGGTTTADNARLTHRYCNNHRSRNDIVLKAPND